MSITFLIAGLGNPGHKYAETRHNAGFWFVDSLARVHGAEFRAHSRIHADAVRTSVSGQDCLLLKPATFMNHSGQAVRAAMDYFQIPAAGLLVAYDDLDLPPGQVRLKLGGGHGGHNGMRDIFRHVPDHQFLRLRVGIGHPGVRDAVTPYVLSRPPADEELQIRSALARALDALPDVLAGNLPAAMKNLHTQVPAG